MMTQRTRTLLLLLILALLSPLAAVTRVQASVLMAGCPEGAFDGDGQPRSPESCECNNLDIDNEQYCMSGFASIIVTLRDTVRLWLIGAQKSLIALVWLLLRVVAIVCDVLIRGEIWQTMRDAILQQLAEVLGGSSGVLYQLIGPQTGLFAVALMLAGLLLVFPFFANQTSRLVKVERVIIWGVLLMGLFVASSSGFDLVAAIEDLRTHMMQTAAGMNDDDEGVNALLNLVAVPLLATPEEVTTIDATLWTLPETFEETFFPDPQFSPRRVIVADAPGVEQLDLIFRVDILENDAYGALMRKSGEALFRVALALLSLYVLSLLAIIFVVLFATALALIVFFLASLPLGFFEFGSTLLMGMTRQYVTIVAVSLSAAVFVRLLSAATFTTLGADLNFADLATYIGMQILVAVLLSMVLKLAWKVADGSFGVMQHSLATVSAMAYSTSGPMGAATEAAKAQIDTAVTAATGAVAGFVTGGVAGAVMGGAGGLLSGSKKAGAVSGLVEAQAGEGSQKAAIFTAAARSGSSPVQAAAGIVATGRRAKAQQPGSQEEAVSAPVYDRSKRLDPKWQAVDMGGYLTADLAALERAERAFFSELRPAEARRHLVAAYGSRALADEVLGLYQSQGPQAAQWVRGVTETAQIAAHNTQQAGEALFDAKGRQSETFRLALGREFDHTRLTGPDDPNLPVVQRLVNATVRKPQNVWQTPQRAPRLLARDTLDPELTEVQVTDTSAQYALRDLAVKEGWDQPEAAPRLEQVFRAYHRAAEANPAAPVTPEAVYAMLRQDPRLAGERAGALREAARLVVLVSPPAEVQLDPQLPPAPQATITTTPEQVILSAPPSEQLTQAILTGIPAAQRSWAADEEEWRIDAEYREQVEQAVAAAREEYGWAVQHVNSQTPPPASAPVEAGETLPETQTARQKPPIPAQPPADMPQTDPIVKASDTPVERSETIPKTPTARQAQAASAQTPPPASAPVEAGETLPETQTTRQEPPIPAQPPADMPQADPIGEASDAPVERSRTIPETATARQAQPIPTQPPVAAPQPPLPIATAVSPAALRPQPKRS